MFTFVSGVLKFENSGKNPTNLVESSHIFQTCNPVPAKKIQTRSGSGQNSRSGRTLQHINILNIVDIQAIYFCSGE